MGLQMNFAKTLIASCVLGICLIPMEASATVVVDYSGLPVNDTNNGFGQVGGVQFLNTTAFQLTSVKILLGASGPTNFRIFQFDSGVGDTTGTLIGSIFNISVNTQTNPWSSLAANGTTIDVSSLNLTLLANTAYGFTFENIIGTGGGSTGGGLSTSDNIGTIFDGTLGGTFSFLQQYEIPFIANGTLLSSTSVPEPMTLSLFGAGLAGAVVLRRRAKKKA
jgi:hypothetical protein